MTDYDNTNKGIISKNDRKTTDKHPDISGSLNVEGIEYFIDGWQKKRNSDGASFYSLSVKRKAKVAEQISRQAGFEPQGAKPATYGDLDESEIPFAAEFR